MTLHGRLSRYGNLIKPAEGGIHTTVGAQINREDQAGQSVIQPGQGQEHGR